MNDDLRGDKRYPSAQRLKVRCASWRDFSEHYAADVSQGGMFLKTSDALPILTELEVEITLPEGHVIPLKARVVHVIDEAQATAEGRIPGLGIQFIDVDATCRQQIQALVDFARWEGNTANRPSLAARLSQVSQSLPPSAVLQALPQTEEKRADSAPRPPPRPSSLPRASDSAPRKPVPKAARTPAPQAAAIDPERIKLGVTQLAHKSFELAIKTFEALVAEFPASLEARQWLGVARARLCIKQDDRDAAAEHYQTVLDLDERNHEARKFVREYHTAKRLNALPFGRYFVKKS